MPSIILLAAIALATLYLCNTYRCFAANLAAAKRSGLPYILLPWDKFNVIWMLTGDFWFPLLQKLPATWTHPWLPYLQPEWLYERKYEPFNTMGSDAILFVAPGGNHCYIANAEAIADITARRADFQKPLERYKDVNLYGTNVVVSEGSTWRRHRKITAPSFSEKNNRVVWDECLRQASALLVHWTNGNSSSETVNDVESDMMSVSLHIISKAGFGVRVLWPHEESSGKEGDAYAQFSSTKPSPGHAMSYKEAMSKLMKNVIWIPLLPRWLRDVLPFEGPRIASQAYDEWGQYMTELYTMKKAEIREGKSTEGLDLLGAVMKGAGLNRETLTSSEMPEQQLSESEILGNAFVFMLAGHETTANAMHFSLVFLALNVTCQRSLQRELAAIFGDRPVAEWDYDQDFAKMMDGMTAAVMYETMRLVPSVTGIPKTTMRGSPQPLTVNGQSVVIPAECIVSLDVPATHHNPRYWPTRPDVSALPAGEDLDEFKPERWLMDKAAGDRGVRPLFKPASGAFLPFSEGQRSCMGRRFAQVEVMAILAAIFHGHSVELAVDDFATDEEVEKMPRGGRQREEVWRKAADRAVKLLKHGMGSVITLQMRKGHVPLRVVRKGEERFDGAG
ncbi:uncharacterized protein K452DRAFT_348009 [Aplosporella prunicola CBS 121167]|uniref:Cytochrome P450 n=1 Tax=Aplosporella prunicola CBS 121167 TaxID=1176127 RepID=A0A6A6BWW7_9PEZI|nr:uncharacterized protein K452DRAFT_348009 [Aplosporella prunicola CBS 121167]KAF2147211.1 hypothetical protein K452DRAFT_348009 [Aplosporella prunicola CBS 121167]